MVVCMAILMSWIKSDFDLQKKKTNNKTNQYLIWNAATWWSVSRY